MTELLIKAIEPADATWIRECIEREFGGEPIVTLSGQYYVETMNGYVAWKDDERVGFIGHVFDEADCEIIVLQSSNPGEGIGSALIEAVDTSARRKGYRYLFVSATNDNLNAMRFYQKRGFQFFCLYRDAMDDVRKIKPGVPLIGIDGIPLTDMIELSRKLDMNADDWDIEEEEEEEE